jgi:hypothetical protein
MESLGVPTLMPVDIVFTEDEVMWGHTVAVLKRSISLTRGYRPRYGYDGDPGLSEVGGVFAEMAAAKYLNRYWMPSLRFQRNGEHDVDRYEVRGTNRRDGCLILRPEDADNSWFILVVGSPPHVQIVGWILGGAGKRDEWRRQPNGRPAAYFVPQSALTPAEGSI